MMTKFYWQFLLTVFIPGIKYLKRLDFLMFTLTQEEEIQCLN